jgi:hypothetical protein
VLIRRSKTDQEGQGAEVAMAGGRRDHRPPGVPPGTAGRLISAFGAAKVVEHYACCVGLDPPHSLAAALRSGFLNH